MSDTTIFYVHTQNNVEANDGNVRFTNPMYDKPDMPKEEISGQAYVEVSDVNLVMDDAQKK